MTVITRYVLRQLTVGMVFVSLALVCVLWLTQSLRFVEMIVNKGLSIGTFLALTMMLMPTFLIVIVPIALFAVVLFTYNRLMADRELVVLRAAGFSPLTLAQPALLLGGATVVVGYLLTLWIIPNAVQSFRELQWSIRNDITTVLLQEGVFNKFGDGLTIFVRSRNANGELLGILLHDKRNPDKPVTLMAERGALVLSERGPRVLMVNGNRQQVSRDTGRMSLLHFDSYTVDFASATGGGNRFRDARERSMSELLYADSVELGAGEYRRAKVELHQRLTSPLYGLGFTLIALACLVPAGFNRRGQTVQIVTAVGAMVAVQAAALGTANLASTSLAFIPLIYLVALLPPSLGLWFLLRPQSFSQLVRRLGLPAVARA